MAELFIAKGLRIERSQTHKKCRVKSVIQNTIFLFFTLSFAIASAVLGADKVQHYYTVTTDEALAVLDVNACFEGNPPAKLVAESLDAVVALRGIWNVQTGEEITPSGFIPMDGIASGGCVRFVVDISQGVQRHDMTGLKVHRIGKDVAVASGLWLWRPESIRANEEIHVRFQLPQDITISTPWHREGSERGHFVLANTPYDWPSWIMLGRFPDQVALAGNTHFYVSVLDGRPPVDREFLLEWISKEAGMVQSVIGKFAYPHVQVTMVPNARARTPAPQAYVTRGGGPAVHLMINQRRPQEEFIADWTATHELSHLFLPFINPDDAWLYEGVASYYQNVIRARFGLMSQEEAWENMALGFRRGFLQAKGQEISLREATQLMYMGDPHERVYWTGAAMMLHADIDLRKNTANEWSLDRVLREFNQCCNSDLRGWSATEVLQTFDKISQTTIFSSLMNRYVDSTEFPDVLPLYEELGLQYIDRKVTLDNRAPLSDLRDRIMAGDKEVQHEAKLFRD